MGFGDLDSVAKATGGKWHVYEGKLKGQSFDYVSGEIAELEIREDAGNAESNITPGYMLCMRLVDKDKDGDPLRIQVEARADSTIGWLIAKYIGGVRVGDTIRIVLKPGDKKGGATKPTLLKAFDVRGDNGWRQAEQRDVENEEASVLAEFAQHPDLPRSQEPQKPAQASQEPAKEPESRSGPLADSSVEHVAYGYAIPGWPAEEEFKRPPDDKVRDGIRELLVTAEIESCMDRYVFGAILKDLGNPGRAVAARELSHGELKIIGKFLKHAPDASKTKMLLEAAKLRLTAASHESARAAS